MGEKEEEEEGEKEKEEEEEEVNWIHFCILVKWDAIDPLTIYRKAFTEMNICSRNLFKRYSQQKQNAGCQCYRTPS